MSWVALRVGPRSSLSDAFLVAGLIAAIVSNRIPLSRRLLVAIVPTVSLAIVAALIAALAYSRPGPSTAILFILALVLLVFALSEKSISAKDVLVAICAGGSVGSTIAILHWFFPDAFEIVTTTVHSRSLGLADNFNDFGGAAALSLVAGLALLKSPTRPHTALIVLATTVSLGGVALSRSVSALGAALCGGLMLVADAKRPLTTLVGGGGIIMVLAWLFRPAWLLDGVERVLGPDGTALRRIQPMERIVGASNPLVPAGAGGEADVHNAFLYAYQEGGIFLVLSVMVLSVLLMARMLTSWRLGDLYARGLIAVGATSAFFMQFHPVLGRRFLLLPLIAVVVFSYRLESARPGKSMDSAGLDMQKSRSQSESRSMSGRQPK